MKKIILAFLVFSLSSLAIADALEIKFVKLVRSANTGDFGAFGADGKIYKIDKDDESIVEDIEKAIKKREKVIVELSSLSSAEDAIGARNQIIAIQRFNNSYSNTAPKSLNFSSQGNGNLMNTYVSDISDKSTIERLFYNYMDKGLKERAECYNRAHVWAWELNHYNDGSGTASTRRRIQVGKSFIFFTSRYIRDYDYKWWFHVAPYLTSNGRTVIMDRTFADRPLSLNNWTNLFIDSRERCEVVSKYSSYENNQRSRDCYIIKTSVHYTQPWQLQEAEETGLEQVRWTEKELKYAFKDAARTRKVPCFKDGKRVTDGSRDQRDGQSCE